ncbi:MAG: DeoR/GlpR family DNA-binding transcription regulator [Armatimonadota bacterium]|nr:DeoR/GlpR family DNA-binding transcription regulator [Armatimonadota bacterium]
MQGTILPERWERIIELVENQGRASVEEIAQTLGVSRPTVRRDLTSIQRRGLIRRLRGGAERSEVARPAITLADSRRVNPVEKELIGRVAAGLVRPGDCVMLDGGFTTYQVARHLPVGDLTVVTNSLDVAQAIATRKDVSLVVLGGLLLVESGATSGPTTESQIAELAADKAILGANAFSPEDGLFADMQLVAEVKKAMIRSCSEIIVVADASKLGKSALYRAAPLDAIGTLVTDDRADEAALEEIRQAGVKVVVASRSEDLTNLPLTPS